MEFTIQRNSANRLVEPLNFVEVKVAPSVQGQALRLEFRADVPASRFGVQVWLLKRGYAKPRPATPGPVIIPRNDDGAHAFVLPPANTSTTNRLALIITRLDANEADPVGAYQLGVARLDQ